jgi:hypothetical protein
MRDMLMTILWAVCAIANLAACVFFGGIVVDAMFGGTEGPHTLLGFIGGVIVWVVPIWLSYDLGAGDDFLDHT